MLDEVKEFLKDTETEVDIIYGCDVKGFPFSDDKMMHKKYLVMLKRNNLMFFYPFYGSYHDYLNDIEPDEYDVLSCLQKYPVEDNMWDFAKEFGYTINSEESYNRVKRIWENTKEEYEKLSQMYNEEELERLAEIAC